MARRAEAGNRQGRSLRGARAAAAGARAPAGPVRRPARHAGTACGAGAGASGRTESRRPCRCRSSEPARTRTRRRRRRSRRRWRRRSRTWTRRSRLRRKRPRRDRRDSRIRRSGAGSPAGTRSSASASSCCSSASRSCSATPTSTCTRRSSCGSPAVTAGAIALLAFGWRLRERRAGYALALQGGGIGVLYLVIFAAFKLYNLIPPAPAFALLVGVAAFSAVVAVHPGLALARGARRLGRLPRADPRVDRRRQPRDALQLLRGAERRHPRASPGSRRGGS